MQPKRLPSGLAGGTSVDEEQSPVVVSIVTPTYQMAGFLPDTLESVRRQRYPHVEHIVVDGGSTDGTTELLRREEEQNPRLQWLSERDRGQPDAIRKGFELARGSILTWLNADDVYLGDDVLDAVLEAFAHNPRADLVTGGGLLLTATGAVRRPIPAPLGLNEHVLRRNDVILQPATFFRRSIADDVPLDIDLHYAFDWDFFIRAVTGREVVVLDRELAGYRYYDSSKTGSGGSGRTAEIAEVTGRYLGRATWQFALLRAAAAVDSVFDRLPSALAKQLRRGLYRGVLRGAFIVSGGHVQN